MATIKRQLTYRCYDDCLQSGCPTHEVKQEFIQELFIPLRKLRKMFDEQNRGVLWSRFGRYSYYLKCERGIYER